MKKHLFVLGVLAAVTAFSSARPCLICLDEENPREAELVAWIAQEGTGAIPSLREIAACPETEAALRIVAVRSLGVFRDREIVPLLRRMVLELIDPTAVGPFGDLGPSSLLRGEAARALAMMGEGDPAELLWAAWDGLSPDRRLEIPRLLAELADPLAQSRQIEILQGTDDEGLAFQTLMELRRSGDAAAAAAIEERLERWRRMIGETGDWREREILNRMIRYAEGTIRALGGR